MLQSQYKGYIVHFFGPRLKTEGSCKIASVRMCVRAYVTAYLKKRSNDFPDFVHDVGDK